ITVSDALCSFQTYLSQPQLPPMGCGLQDAVERMDVDCNESVTPGDALCIFRHWLDGSCSFCDDSSSASVGVAGRARDALPTVVVPEILIDGHDVTIPVNLTGQPSLDAFGFEVTFPSDRLEYAGMKWAASIEEFDQLDGRVVEKGRLRLGGYTTSEVDGMDTGIVEVQFRAGEEPLDGLVIIEEFVDDLEGAPVVEVSLGQGNDNPVFRRYVLQQNYPNPFNPRTLIEYEIPDHAANVHVKLIVYDVEGRVVRGLVDTPKDGGAHEVEWDGTNDHGNRVSSGVYFCVLRAGGIRLAKKMVVLK
ncbi:MAG: T9SS type A sorting domain-containing protein, partial [Candidatus Latescibacterota bacterium]